jgi:hypothetical protein
MEGPEKRKERQRKRMEGKDQEEIKDLEGKEGIG